MRTIIIALKVFIFFSLLTGIIYPLLITGVAQALYPENANGSILKKDGQMIGSLLIGQQFDSAVFFSSRPSSVSYNPLPSGGSNYGYTNKRLEDLVSQRRHKFISENRLDTLISIPSEMLFSSGSGLDPHISPEAAYLQIDRIAHARNFDNLQKRKLEQLINDLTEPPQYLVFGEKRVNVLLLNLKVDQLQ